jgi:hypothetical protein
MQGWRLQNAALNCRRLLKGARKRAVAVELEGDQTRWLPWTSRLPVAAASSAASAPIPVITGVAQHFADRRVYGHLGIASWRRTVRNDPTEALPISGHQSVDRVDNWRQPKPPESAAERSSELYLSKEHNARTRVSPDGCAVAAYEPPAFAAPLLGHRCE